MQYTTTCLAILFLRLLNKTSTMGDVSLSLPFHCITDCRNFKRACLNPIMRPSASYRKMFGNVIGGCTQHTYIPGVGKQWHLAYCARN